MHCSACGKSVNALSYCNNCGARLAGGPLHDANNLSESSLNFLLACILGIPIAGVGVLIGLMKVMKELGFTLGPITVFGSAGLILLLVAEAVFVWLLISRTRKVKTTDGAASAEVVTRELAEAHVNALPEPLPSVTENTTRSFEPVPRGSKSR